MTDRLRPVTRRRLAAATLVLLVPALAACSSFEYQTDQVYQPGVGVNDRSGTVDVLGAVVVRTSEGEGTLVASLVNTDPEQEDSLTTVSGDGLETDVVSPVDLAPDSLLNLAEEGAVMVNGDRVAPGNWVRMTLEFESGQQTEINVPVVSRTGEFADVSSANQ
jgi:hypothetical protein